ncbi:uncharacterized protein LOC119077419 isoform X1 [Bradysia coprophila]|nr:uncharacterized protein LOC119077419 isoform X1 [Bradysia coprophila]
MKVPHVRMATHVFEKCLTNNPNLEGLEFDHFWYREDITNLSELFPRLRYLRLIEMAMGEDGSAQEPKRGKSKKPCSTPFDYTVVLDLLQSDTLTHFSFESEKTCNQLIQLLASHKRNLEKLSFTMNVNKQTFADIGRLKNLKFLAIANGKGVRKIGSDVPKWPPKLACLTLNNIVISDTELLSIVEHLPLLEELYIGTTSARLHPWLRDMKIFSGIEKIVGKGSRTLKIFFSDASDKNPYKYKSANLEIINECAVKTTVKPLHIMISS